MKLSNKFFAAAAALAMCLAATGAFAGEATDRVKENQDKLFALVAQPKSEARQKKLRSLFDDVLAYDVIARKSLGRAWDDLDEEQQAKFTELLTKLVRNNYRRNLKKMLDYNIRYRKEKKKKRHVLVRTKCKHKTDGNEPDIEIDFKMRKIGGKLMVIDIVTERASLVKTYRAQFLKIIRKKGFDKLIEKMEKKLKKQGD